MVVLSYSLSNDTAQELVDLLEQYCPRCPIIVLPDRRWDDREIRPDQTVLASDGQIQYKRLYRVK